MIEANFPSSKAHTCQDDGETSFVWGHFHARAARIMDGRRTWFLVACVDWGFPSEANADETKTLEYVLEAAAEALWLA